MPFLQHTPKRCSASTHSTATGDSALTQQRGGKILLSAFLQVIPKRYAALMHSIATRDSMLMRRRGCKIRLSVFFWRSRKMAVFWGSKTPKTRRTKKVWYGWTRPSAGSPNPAFQRISDMISLKFRDVLVLIFFAWLCPGAPVPCKKSKIAESIRSSSSNARCDLQRNHSCRPRAAACGLLQRASGTYRQAKNCCARCWSCCGYAYQISIFSKVLGLRCSMCDFGGSEPGTPPGQLTGFCARTAAEEH